MGMIGEEKLLGGDSQPLGGEALARLIVNGQAPVRVFSDVAAHHVEVERLQPPAQLADASLADGAVVDRADGGYLSTCTAKDKLIANVKLCPVDPALHDLQAHLFAQQGHNGETGDAFEDVV